MSATFARRARRTFAWMLLIPTLLGVVTVWATLQYRESINWVSHTKDVLLSIQDLERAITDAESSKRGFLITGDGAFRSKYENDKDQIAVQIDRLREFISDNPKQQATLRLLTPVVTNRIGEMQHLVALKQDATLSQSETVSAISSGRLMMAEILHFCDQMRRDEERLLAIRIQVENRTAIYVGTAVALAVSISVALLFWAERMIREYANGRDRAEMEIRALNADLEQRVRDRTADLEGLNAQLNRSNKDLTHFAYIASHDLQEPLRTIGSYASLLGRRYEGKLDEKADRYIHHLVDGAKRMQSLVQGLLAYSRAGTQQLKITTVDVGNLLTRILDGMQTLLIERQASVICEDLPSLKADPDRLDQVFQNLIGNALKFAKPGEVPVVHISARRDALDWVFSIRDNGIGFEQQFADQIFVIFQRLHQVGMYPGTGIGLAICKRIIEAHGGRIWATSAFGEGSTFSFSLPVLLKQDQSETHQEPVLIPELVSK